MHYMVGYIVNSPIYIYRRKPVKLTRLIYSNRTVRVMLSQNQTFSSLKINCCFSDLSLL